MLIDVSIKEPIKEIYDGVYLCPHDNFEDCIDEKLKLFKHGVVDSVGQFRDEIASQLHEAPIPYVCVLKRIVEEAQLDLYNDEVSELKEVYTFRIFEVENE